MRSIFAITAARLRVCVLGKNGWTDRDDVWTLEADLCEPKKPLLGGVHIGATRRIWVNDTCARLCDLVRLLRPFNCSVFISALATFVIRFFPHWQGNWLSITSVLYTNWGSLCGLSPVRQCCVQTVPAYSPHVPAHTPRACLCHSMLQSPTPPGPSESLHNTQAVQCQCAVTFWTDFSHSLIPASQSSAQGRWHVLPVTDKYFHGKTHI